MERRIGEVFRFKERWLKVKEEDAKNACRNCYLTAKDCSKYISLIGECLDKKRSDNKDIVFEDVTYNPREPQEKQKAEQQAQKLNLCEILKDCPKGTELWSDNYGEVRFLRINIKCETPIEVKRTDECIAYYTKEGWHSIHFPANCLLWPSRDCRDWSKFTAPWYKKERFDQKTLRAFDKVLVNHDDIWKVDIFSHICQYEPNGWCQCIGDSYYICIPYNDKTKHLLGTKDEAPDFYRYWEE